MRFAIKQVGCGSERIGFLSGFAKSAGTIIETPSAALFTKGGSVAHLTVDVLSKVFSSPQLLWVPLSNSIQLENGIKAQGEGIAKFSGLSNNVVCTTLSDINESHPPGHFEGDTVPLWTRNGKKKLTADRYMEVMEAFKPDIILAIADGRTSLHEPHKRISKSVERTNNMLETCIRRYKASVKLQDSALIGVIVGVARQKECKQSIQSVLQYEEELGGIALSGITDGEEDSKRVSAERIEYIFREVGESVPKSMLRIVEGCWNPAIVMVGIEHGWDLFDGSYPAALSNAGQALALSFECRGSEELCVLDLNDRRYKEDFAPILDGCECLVCKKHTRAYIHHLLNTREMLAQVLLSMHNLHHFDKMFRVARQHISSNTFQIFKSIITKQYELYKETQKSDDIVKNEIDLESKLTSLQNNKKKRILNGDAAPACLANGSS